MCNLEPPPDNLDSGALEMLQKLVESLKLVDRGIGDVVYYWEEYLHKRQMSEMSPSSHHANRMFYAVNPSNTHWEPMTTTMEDTSTEDEDTSHQFKNNKETTQVSDSLSEEDEISFKSTPKDSHGDYDDDNDEDKDKDKESDEVVDYNQSIDIFRRNPKKFRKEM